MPHDLLTTIVLCLMTLLGACASTLAIRRVRKGTSDIRSAKPQLVMIVVGIALAGMLLVYRQRTVDDWHPLVSHLDGLITLALVLGITIVYLQTGERLPGLAAFLTPIWTLMTGWGICASAWTWKAPWPMTTIWDFFHTLSVYGGMFFVVLAAASGALFLYVDRRLRHRRDLSGVKPLASLESLERVMINSATGGFVLLTLGLITGLLRYYVQGTVLGEGWWHSPKIVLGFLAWLVFALLMNVRFTSTFRGTRAAWLSIVGLVLLIATFGAVSVLESKSTTAPAVGGADTSLLLVEVTPCA